MKKAINSYKRKNNCTENSTTKQQTQSDSEPEVKKTSKSTKSESKQIVELNLSEDDESSISNKAINKKSNNTSSLSLLKKTKPKTKGSKRMTIKK